MMLRSDINFFDNRFLMFVLDQMAYEYERDNKDVIRMTLGKSELPLNPNIIKKMKDALDDYNKYSLVFPGGLPVLKERLSKYYKDKRNVEIDPNNFIISVGTSTLFRNLFYLLLKEGDEVLIPHPYYSLYHFSALLSNATIKYYKINPKTLKLDIDSFKDNFTDKTKVVVINSPGNPLGNILSKDDLYEIDNIVNGRAVIINDEIYANVSFDESAPSVMELTNTKSTFIITDAFSKGHRMYSRRVGYCIVPDELVNPMTVIQHHTLLTLDPVVQFGAIAALDFDHDVDYLTSIYKERRNYTIQKFSDVKGVDALLSKGSFYITLDCEDYMKQNHIGSSLELATRIMESKNVATVPGSDFGLPYTLRLSFSNNRYNEGINRLASFFNGQ